jgi:hypothetical protein
MALASSSRPAFCMTLRYHNIFFFGSLKPSAIRLDSIVIIAPAKSTMYVVLQIHKPFGLQIWMDGQRTRRQ